MSYIPIQLLTEKKKKQTNNKPKRDAISLNMKELPSWVEPVSDLYCCYRQQGTCLQRGMVELLES